MVSCWPNCFCGGCVSIDNDPRLGRLRTSTNERRVKLVADALEEDYHATCEELSRTTEAKLLRKMHKNRSQLLVARPLILHDSARLHIVDVVTRKLRDYRWEVLPRAPYSPAMSPPDFDLFPKLKERMRG